MAVRSGIDPAFHRAKARLCRSSQRGEPSRFDSFLQSREVSRVGERLRSVTKAKRVTVRVLALDLERTLIDNSLSARPRPGLFAFLEFCQERFERVVLFTTVEEADAREVLESLAESGHIPPGFLARLEYVDWCGEHKNLEFVPGATPAEVLLVDDDAGWVRPDQRDQWIPIEGWDRGADSELVRVRSALEDWIRRAGAEPILESLPDAKLLVVCDQAMNPAEEEELAELLERNREGQLTPVERTRLHEQMRAYRTGLVRKAQALKVAVQRGLRPPLS